MTNPDGSLTITANQGYQFPGGKKSVTYPEPTDSNEPCPGSSGDDRAGHRRLRARQRPLRSDPHGPWTATVNPDRSLTVTAARATSSPTGRPS